MIDSGLFLIRLVFGLVMAAHGSQKLFGWFGGYGLHAVAGMFESLGFRPGRAFAPLAATSELVGGLLMALGAFGPIGPAAVLSVMIVAAVSVHWANGLFASTNGIEVPLLYGTAAMALALTGPGRYSLDAVSGLGVFWNPAVSWTAIAAAIIGGVASLALRRPAPVAA
jgi:putative oxidoreductase